jgi:hypothetical protein
VDFSDMPNVRLCLEKTKAADLQLRIDENGEYHKENGTTVGKGKDRAGEDG